MRRIGWLMLGACATLIAMTLVLIPANHETKAQETSKLVWIWTSEGNALESAKEGKRYFRKSVTLTKFADEATLDITADNGFKVWIDGKEVGSGDKWERVYRFDVTKQMLEGTHVIAVEAMNEAVSPAGLLVKLAYTPNGQSKISVYSNATWKWSDKAVEGWQTTGFDDSKWQSVKVLCDYGEGPWKKVAWDAGGDDRFNVPDGFRVEMVVPPTTTYEGMAKNLRFSLVNMCFDAKGRLLVSQEGGPILLCEGANRKGVYEKVRPYCDLIKNCHGMCWIDGALYLVGDGPQGTGFYRCSDTKQADKCDTAELLLKFQGGMGEHGPHAVIHGPDDKVYLVLGNHAWAKVDKLAANSPLTRWPTGLMGPDQNKPNTTEDVLLPRLNDARGHAADILAPGGTIWRLDKDGKNPALVAAGFRNQFDAAFNPRGELFTFDSDMEWDEGLPWYRAVRVCHCISGADFVWRTGAANTPNYYLDSLPPVVETGRGSPVGVEFYDHSAFPSKYRGAFFMADWSIGVIWAVAMTQDGATYSGKLERFCSGSPMPVSDVAVGPDGALYFCVGGRQTAGGVYRIVFEGERTSPDPADSRIEALLQGIGEQPLAPWQRFKNYTDGGVKDIFTNAALDPEAKLPRRLRDLQVSKIQGTIKSPEAIGKLITDKSAEIRAEGISLLGLHGNEKSKEQLLKALNDPDPVVKRRACEALVRLGIEPDHRFLKPLLTDKDQFVRTAARLVLQRIDPKKWAEAFLGEANDVLALETIVALCKIHQAKPYTEQIFQRLHDHTPAEKPEAILNWLRTIQLALVHTSDRPGSIRGMAVDCAEMFPHKDPRVTRELAIVLTEFTRLKVSDNVTPKMMKVLVETKDDRQLQIHLFYCLRLVKTGWTPELKSQLLAWFDSTKTWTGGFSFTPFLENILRDCNDIFTAEDRLAALERAKDQPWAASAMLRISGGNDLPPKKLFEMYQAMLKDGGKDPRSAQMREGIVQLLGNNTSPETQGILRQIGDADPAQKIAVSLALLKSPTSENLPHIIRGLEAQPNPGQAMQIINVLKKVKYSPKQDDASPFRAAMIAASRLNQPDHKWAVVELLRHWTNDKSFGGEKGEWKSELTAWARWYAQNFPKEGPLPDFSIEITTDSKWKFDELAQFLEKDPKGKGDPVKGRIVFTKGLCIKCHKFGNEGEGVGPDLTTISKRFKRSETLESLLYPSKVISDQYRSKLVFTKNGVSYTGIVSEVGDTVTIVMQDATKATVKKNEIEQRVDSLVSVMPDKLIDTLTREEIADLFAYLETDPAKK